MWISAGLTNNETVRIDLPDREFFSLALSLARSHAEVAAASGLEAAELKMRCPVVYCSCFDDEDDCYGYVPRRIMNIRNPRRRFIMGDMDFNPGEEAESEEARRALVEFAARHRAPLMLYPTASYPAKPRFRWVTLSNRALGAEAYAKAVRWLCEDAGIRVNDEGDYRVLANRNLPFFWNDGYEDAIYDTFGDAGLKPLDSRLWRDVECPIRISKSRPEDLGGVPGRRYSWTVGDPDGLVSAVRDLCSSASYLDRLESWKMIRSISASAKAGSMDAGTAERCARAVAACAPDSATRRAWEEGNLAMLAEEMDRMDDPADMAKARPLFTFGSLVIGGNLTPPDEDPEDSPSDLSPAPGTVPSDPDVEGARDAADERSEAARSERRARRRSGRGRPARKATAGPTVGTDGSGGAPTEEERAESKRRVWSSWKRMHSRTTTEPKQLKGLLPQVCRDFGRDEVIRSLAAAVHCGGIDRELGERLAVSAAGGRAEGADQLAVEMGRIEAEGRDRISRSIPLCQLGPLSTVHWNRQGES